MAIHYKFVNELELSHVMLDGDVSISASDLKRAVVRDRKLGRVTHFDLVVRNEADLEADFFERNTTVTVARVPLVGTKVKTWWEEVIVAATSKESRSTSEEKHIDEIIRQSAEMYAPKNWLNKSKKSMVKNTTGIPRTFLQLASSKDAPGAKKTPYGAYGSSGNKKHTDTSRRRIVKYSAWDNNVNTIQYNISSACYFPTNIAKRHCNKMSVNFE